MLKRSIAILLVPLALAGLAAMAPAASADPNPPGCVPGNFCAYASSQGTRPPLLATPRNWSGSISGVSYVFNNGVPYPGADHIQLDYHFSGQPTRTVCIHYNPGPGHEVLFGAPVTITRATWRGEC